MQVSLCLYLYWKAPEKYEKMINQELHQDLYVLVTTNSRFSKADFCSLSRSPANDKTRGSSD